MFQMSLSAVANLQKSILENRQSLTQMLRETKVIAAKLNLEDVEHWVDYELNGYPSEVEPPSYREYSTKHLEIRNPVRGWEFAGHLHGTLRAREPIAQIEDHSKGAELTTSVRENFPVRD